MAVPSTRWDRHNLAQRVCHALAIAKHAVERLLPSGYTDREQPANSVRPEKLISETALLLLVASNVRGFPEVEARIAEVTQLLIPHARSERILLGVCLQPALALDYAQAHAVLHRLGYPDDAFAAVLRQSVGAHASQGCERPPHRMLEQHWIAELATVTENRVAKREGEATRFSLLNHPMDLLSGSRDDLYAFTHAVMYAARFTNHPRRWPRSRRAILAEAEGALARCLDREDYDLAGELLLAWPLTGEPWSVRATFGFRVLARVEDVAGFLPTPSTRLARMHALQGDDRECYLVATAYHTAYVMGLLCAAALMPGRLPPQRKSNRRRIRGAASAILEHLEADGGRRHWQDDLAELTEEERDANAGFLLDVGLHRLATGRDFDGMRRLLQIGDALHLTDSPVSIQAAEMLERLATLAGLIADQQHSATLSIAC